MVSEHWLLFLLTRWALWIQYSACSLVGFSHGLSAMVQYFPLIINQHQPGLSAPKLTSEQADWIQSAMCDEQDI